ncbi:MAG: hypothetical protein FJ316_02030 [SAR202 cluster bacterium]|nr:hypothetical protein [SAR202 cluster bacterium]
MKKLLMVAAVVILVLLIVVVGVLGYYGFAPGVSSLLGANKPKDLGVSYTEQHLQSARAKLGQQFMTLPQGTSAAQSRQYSGQKSINASFTQEELTALVNDQRWAYHPVTDAQVRINPDGTVEFSGKLLIDRLDGFGQSIRLSQQEQSYAQDFLKFVKTDPAIYAKGSLTVVNNQLDLNVTEAKVGRLDVPVDDVTDDPSYMNEVAQRARASVTGLSVTSLNFQGGQMNLNASIPATESVLPP